MTPEYAQIAVEEIVARFGDPEAAHGYDDDLRTEFLRALATGGVQPGDIQKIAGILLSTQDAIDRWYA